MSAPIFCKFGHTTTLHAEGDKIRIYWHADQGYSCGPGHDDFKLDPHSGPIVAAVNVSNLVCHVMTMRDVYEINAEHGLVIRRIGPTMRAGSTPKAVPAHEELKAAAQEVARARRSPSGDLLTAIRRLERAAQVGE